MGEVKKWALFAYFAANVPEQGMHKAAIKHLRELASVGSSESIHLAAQLYLPGMLPRRYILPEGPEKTGTVTIYPDPSDVNANSADPKSIQDFIEWASEKCPAENTIVVLCGHGYGIDDYLPPNTRMHPTGQGIEALKMVAPTKSTSSKVDGPLNQAVSSNNILMPQDMIWNGIVDSHTGEVIPNASIGQAVRDAKLSEGSKLAILGFDSCEMSMAEVWCEMKGCAPVGISSQAPIPYQGWPYDTFLKRLMKAPPDASPEFAAKSMVDSFVQSYADEKKLYVTLSALRMSNIDSLTEAFRKLSDALTATISDQGSRDAIFKARNNSPIYDPDGFVDLGTFCKFLQEYLPVTAVKDACKLVITANEALVIFPGFSPPGSDKRISQSTGLSIWFPGWIQDPSIEYPEMDKSEAYLIQGYPETEFAKQTGWSGFLEALKIAVMKAARASKLNAGSSLQTKNANQRQSGGSMPAKNSKGTEGHRGGISGKEIPSGGSVSSGATNMHTSAITSKTAGVVLRATVETFGPVGEAELNFNVKWSAAALASAPSASYTGSEDDGSESDDEKYKGVSPEGNLKVDVVNP